MPADLIVLLDINATMESVYLRAIVRLIMIVHPTNIVQTIIVLFKYQYQSQLILYLSAI